MVIRDTVMNYVGVIHLDGSEALSDNCFDPPSLVPPFSCRRVDTLNRMLLHELIDSYISEGQGHL